MKFTSLLLGMIFIISGFFKSVNIISFTQEVRQYIDLYLPILRSGWSREIAIAICCIELSAGSWAMMRLYRILVSMSFLLMLSIFLYITGINAFFPSKYFGSIESCGCFGELVHFTPVASFFKSAMLWIMSVVLFLLYMSNVSMPCITQEIKKIIFDTRTYILLLLSCLPLWFSERNLESMDYGVYITIYVLLCLFVCVCVVMMYSKLSSEKFRKIFRKQKANDVESV